MAICTIALLLVLWVLGQVLAAIAHALLLFAFGAVLAFLLAPLVDLGTRHGVARPLTIARTYLALVVLTVGGTVLLAAPLIAQLSQLLAAQPRYTVMVNDGLLQLDHSLQSTPLAGSLAALEHQLLAELGGIASIFLDRLLRGLSSR